MCEIVLLENILDRKPSVGSVPCDSFQVTPESQQLDEVATTYPVIRLSLCVAPLAKEQAEGLI